MIEAHRAVVREARVRHPRARVILAGKSMGGRMGCHVSLDEPDVGKVMAQVMPKFKGRADGKVINQIVREELQAG